MAFQKAVGHVALPTGAGAQSIITGLAFQPTGVFNFFTQQTTTGFLAGLLAHFGMIGSVGGVTDGCCQVVALDNVGAADTGRARSGTRMIFGSNTAGAMGITIECDATTFDADGLNGSFANAADAAYLWPYIALGGDVTVGVAVADSGTTDGATVDFTRSGLGTPEAFIVVSPFSTASSTAADACISIGAGDGTNQWAACYASQDAPGAGGATNAQGVIRNDRVLACLDPDVASSYQLEASFNSFITDGVRLTINNAPAATSQIYVFLINGGFWKVGTDTQPTTNSTKTTSGLSFVPEVLMACSPSCPTMGTIETGTNAGRFTIGATDDTNQRGISWHDTDAADPTVVEMSQYHDHVLRMHTADGGSRGDATFDLHASLGQFDSTWTNVNGTQYPWGYIVGGGSAVGGGGGAALRRLPLLGVG